MDGAEFETPALPGLRITALPVEGKPGPYSAYRENPRIGDNIGLIFRDPAAAGSCFIRRASRAIPPAVERVLNASDCVLVDGTFWSDDEMIRIGVSHKRARDLGHLPQSGAGGMAEQLARLPHARAAS